MCSIGNSLILFNLLLFVVGFIYSSANLTVTDHPKKLRKHQKWKNRKTLTRTNTARQEKQRTENMTELLEDLMMGYDKRLRPNYQGEPVDVGITMYVLSVGSLSEVNMDFTIDFYFRQYWQDPRLQFSNSEEELCISNEMLDRIWWPDTFFANAKSAKFHTATTKNAFLRINPSGLITQSLRLTVTAMCNMDLTLFPMDVQICSLEIESYAYSTSHILYRWKDGPIDSVGIATNVQLPQFAVRGYRTVQRIEGTSTGNYSRLACHILFGRSLGYYVIHIYIPSSLIVVLSWVSFWLHRDAAPARVALGITTVLTMTTLISSTNAALPKISYLKSIDVYLVTCFVMVFVAIVEYAAVSYIANRKTLKAAAGGRQKTHRRSSSSTSLSRSSWPDNAQSAVRMATNYEMQDGINCARRISKATEVRVTSMNQVQNDNLKHLPPSHCVVVTPCSEKYPLMSDAPSVKVVKQMKEKQAKTEQLERNIRIANKIDFYSRILFPLTFASLSAIYWVVYLHVSTSIVEDDFVILE